MSPKEIAEKTIRSLYKEAPVCILASAYLELEKKLSLEQQDRESEKREFKVFKDAAENEITKLKKSREGLRKACEFYANTLNWEHHNNSKPMDWGRPIINYNDCNHVNSDEWCLYGGKKSREAIKADDEIMKGE